MAIIKYFRLQYLKKNTCECLTRLLSTLGCDRWKYKKLPMLESWVKNRPLEKRNTSDSTSIGIPTRNLPFHSIRCCLTCLVPSAVCFCFFHNCLMKQQDCTRNKSNSMDILIPIQLRNWNWPSTAAVEQYICPSCWEKKQRWANGEKWQTPRNARTDCTHHADQWLTVVMMHG